MECAQLVPGEGERLLVGIDAMGPVDDVTDRAISSLRPYGK